MDNIKFLKIQNRILWLILMSISFMWLMSWGSFDPRKLGFYGAILFAICCEVVTNYFINKYRIKKENVNNA